MPDILDLGGLDPARIEEAKQAKNVKRPTQIEQAREERLNAKEARMASKQAAKFQPPPSAPPPPELTPEMRSHLLDQLSAYRERFPGLKERNKINGKSTHEEIQDEIHYVKSQLGGRRDGNLGFMLFTGSMTALEMTTEHYINPMGLNLTGLAQVSKDNYGEVEAIIDEMLIKHGTGVYMSPEMRLVLAVGAMVATVHLANSGDPKLANTLKQMNQRIKVPQAAKDL